MTRFATTHAICPGCDSAFQPIMNADDMLADCPFCTLRFRVVEETDILKQRDDARRASAAWKAKCKLYRAGYREIVNRWADDTEQLHNARAWAAAWKRAAKDERGLRKFWEGHYYHLATRRRWKE